MPYTSSSAPITRSELVRLIAPCGLHCGGCLAFAGGPIRNHARALRDLLGPNFGNYAQRLSGMNPALTQYNSFAGMLEFLAKGSCKGCRDGGCIMGECGVRSCAMKREIDFCGLCPDFPCENPGLPESLRERWATNGELLRDRGPTAYLELARMRPRYP